MKIDRRRLLTGLSATLVLPRLPTPRPSPTRQGGPSQFQTISNGFSRPALLRQSSSTRLRRNCFSGGHEAPNRRSANSWAQAPATSRKSDVSPGVATRPISKYCSSSSQILILDVGTVNDTYISLATSVQQQTGIPYVFLDGRFAASAQLYGQFFGEITHRQVQAEEFARYTENTVATIKRRIKSTKSPSTKGPRFITAAGRMDWRPASAVRSMWKRSSFWVPATSPRSARAEWRRYPSSRCWRGTQTSVVAIIEPTFAANLRSDPAWAPIKAVKTGRIYLSPKLPFGWVDFPPSVNRLIGLWWLAKTLYPDQFPEDLRPLTHEFYRRFYHVTPTDTQIDRVLAGAG